MKEATQLATVDATEVKPLVNWKNAPTLLQLKQDYTDAKPFQDAQNAKIRRWLDNLNVEGEAKIKVAKGNSAIQPKLIRKQAEWRYAALSEPFLSTDDVFNVKPTTFEDRDAAQQNQLVLNHQFNTHIDKTKFIDEYVRAAVDEGTVIVRTGWDFEEETYIDEQSPIVEFVVNPEYQQAHLDLAEMKEKMPSLYQTDVPDELKEAHEMTIENGQPIEPIIKGYEKKEKTRVLRNRPTAEVVDYRNVTFDPTCLGDIRKAGFAVFSFDTSKAKLEADGKYKNLDKINVANNTILAQPDHYSSEGAKTFNFNDDARKLIVGYEYWGFWDIHKEDKLVAFVATWVGDTLIRMELNPMPDKEIPFISEQYLPVRKSIYGEPDGELLEDNQKVMGAVTRGMIDLMGKSANGQTGTAKSFLDTTNRRKFDKGLDYEYNHGNDPSMSVYMHKYPEIPQSAIVMLQMQGQEAESLTGVQSFSQGISGKALGDVAAGVRGALDAASKRELGILRRLSNGIIKVGRKWISMTGEFMSDEEIVRVTNDTFVTVKKDDLAGSFDLKLSISTAEEDANKAEELGFLLQTIGPNDDPKVRNKILGDIARLKKMPDLAQWLEDYQPEPDPLQQEKAQLEVELLKAQIAKENALAQQAGSTAQLNQAKVPTEAAKQQNLTSDTDQKNLDFVEQESGVKQERDIEKVGEQARGNAKLKLMDAQFKQQGNREKLKTDLLKAYMTKHPKKAA